MKENIILMIKGFVLGIANIIPGVSGGTLAITLGIYEELINTISHLFRDIKKNLAFIIPIALGAVLSILLASKIITTSLENYPIPTTMFFIGLIVGGIPLIYQKVRNTKKGMKEIFAFLIPFFLILFMAFIKGERVFSLEQLSFFKIFLLFFVGMIASATMVIPGVSGSFVLMLLGFYKPILHTISHITKMKLLGHHLLILFPFGIGILVGIVVIARVIEYLLKKHEVLTYYAILGFIMSSILSLFFSLLSYDRSILAIIVGVLLFLLGAFIGYQLGDESS